MTTGRIVIVAYRPKAGHEAALLEVVAKHVQVLAQEGLVTSREPTVMRAADGVVVEVFEWAGADAIARAHSNPAVGALWAEFSDVCDFVPLAQLPEARQMFAEFEPVASEARVVGAAVTSPSTRRAP